LVRLQQKSAGFPNYSNFGAKIFCDVGPAAAKKSAGFSNYSNFGAKIFCDVGPAAAKKAGFSIIFKFWRLNVLCDVTLWLADATYPIWLPFCCRG
jgi:hypothetical protein